MRNKLRDYQELYGDLYNLEATPAESTTYRLAKHDKEKYPDIITAGKSGDETPYYTNSSHLPVSFSDDVFSALDIQDGLQTLYTSGTVFHTFLGEKLPSWQSCMALVKKIASNYHIPYFTISPTYSVCEDHGYLAGEVHKCPICGKETEVYSRITGYYRPVKNWNAGKTQEFSDRKEYKVETSRDIQTNTTCECEKEEKIEQKIDEIILFATKTCPNCKMAKALLDQAGIKYKVVNAEDDRETTIAFGIKKAPTLLVPNGNTYDVYENASLIKGYIENSFKKKA
jgi:ribonucleoside-triphosphate reductase